MIKQDKKTKRLRRRAKTTYIQKRSSRPTIKFRRTISHLYAFIVERREKGDHILVTASTLDIEFKAVKGPKVDISKQVGQLLGKRALEKNINLVNFDRGGHKYHGRVKALAEGAREAGLNF